ncbi:MAG: hypothetical protein C0621_11000 [Desulfuromonas sp.]|nr:MAG: hypothetical protein C0621_11000 [Desulfuromonas sp.]
MRQIIVSVIYNSDSLLQPGKLKESLVRAAHHSLIRHTKGITDTVLFILLNAPDKEKVAAAIEKYGFPNVVMTFPEQKMIIGDTDGINNLDEESCTPDELLGKDDCESDEFIGEIVSRWLEEQHPGALPYLAIDGYDNLNVWWSGIEASEDEIDYSDVELFSKELPGTHKKRSATWLKILENTKEDPNEYHCYLGQQYLSLLSTVLCEWLHGFDAVSGNGYNNFDPLSIRDNLGLDDIYIGYIWGQDNPGISLEEMVCDGPADDSSELIEYALRSITENYRIKIKEYLVDVFGSDSYLFFSLHASIWPRYFEPIGDHFSSLTNCDLVDYGELERPWSFVTDGWDECAD